MNLHIRNSLLAAVSVAAFLPSGAAQAQDSSQGGFEDIVVTARKQTERLLDVPVAVTAIGAE